MSDADDSILSDISLSDLSDVSLLSRSPSPPSPSDLRLFNLPSPPASQDPSSLESTPTPETGMARTHSQRGEDGAPPAKRRRVTEPKPRTTEHLNLSAVDSDAAQQEQLERLLKVLHKRRKIVVIAGAGISVSAGIPDFRSSTGLFKTLKTEHRLKSSGKQLFDASVYQDGESTAQFHDMVRNLATMTKGAQPTQFHHLLATLAQQGRLLRLYTQNVDCIDTSLPPLETQIPVPAKGPWPKTIQLHGSVDKMVCTRCNNISDLDPTKFTGPTPSACTLCLENDTVRTEHAGKRSHGVGKLRPRMVLYNEWNPDSDAIGACSQSDLNKRPDALIVVGTTLKIPGVKRIVKEMCGIIRDRRDGLTIWINNDPPPPSKDFAWDLIVKGPADEVARRACMRKWNEEDTVESASDEQIDMLRSKGSPAVVIPSPGKNKTIDRVQGIPTPISSPREKPLTIKLSFNPAPKQPTLVTSGQTAAMPKKASAKAARSVSATTKPQRKPSQKKAPGAKRASTCNVKLGFKVGKPMPASDGSKPAKSAPTSKYIPNSSADSQPSIKTTNSSPMQPLPVTDARINAQKPSYDGDSLPGLKKRGLKVDTTPTARRESPEERRRTISPMAKDYLPTDMRRLIDFE